MAPDAQENGNEKTGRMPGEPSRLVLADLGTGPNSSSAVVNGGKLYEEEAQREWEKLAPILRENGGDRERLPVLDTPVTPAKDASSSQSNTSITRKLPQDSCPRPGVVRRPSLDRIRDSKASLDSTPARAVPTCLDDNGTSTAATGHARSRHAQRHTISEHVHDGLSRRANKALEDPPEFLLAADDPPTHAVARRRPAVPRIASSPVLTPRRNSVNDEQRATTSKKEPPGPTATDWKDHNATGQPTERIPSPMPQSIPLPPLSIPTYLQLELSSERPSRLYIHRSATADFPYESSQVKMERLINFLVLPLALEQVLWFGALTCLDAWLYLFTILPLRFARALYILMSSWAINLNAEIRFVCGFIIEGVGRVYRRQFEAKGGSLETKQTPKASSSRRKGHFISGPEGRPRAKSDLSRRSRQSSAHKHRRQKSVPSALLPDDKADILKGLLTIATCIVLMRFDASQMYHWIRGQAAIKLYVIYNVLEVGDRLLSAIGQDVLECLFSKEALERKPNGRSKILRPFWLFHLALAYTVLHAMALFYQVITLNVAVNSYSNALITLLLSNQFVEIKSTVFKKFEKENLFQLTCADVVERFQLWLMLTIIASRNIVETGVFTSWFSLGSLKDQAVANTNNIPLATPPKTSSSILPQSFTLFPSSLLASLSGANSILPTMAQVLGPFLIVLGSEMLVDWLKHAYINKFNNTRPTIYGRFLDVLAKDYYVHAFADQNLTRRLGLPVIPLACLFFRVSVQTYQMFLASCLPTPSGPMQDRPTLSTIREQYSTTAGPFPSTTPHRMSSLMSSSIDRISSILSHAIPSPAHSVTLFTILFVLISYVILLLAKLGMGMALLSMSRARYKAMKDREREYESLQAKKPTAESHVVEGHRRVGGWGTVEVNDDKRRWIYVDDPNGLRKLREREERDRAAGRGSHGIAPFEGVKRYEMAAKRICEITQDNYFLPRHKDESSRLNFQHKLLVDICGGNTIHESISKENITAIADVATGTGVWIQDAKSILTAHDPEKPRKYFAWDISDAQFSDPAARDGIIFSLHDGRQPFSEEFHNQFDLVHVRLLVAALKTPEYKQVVDNLVSLLKPGGYLQWEDLSMESYLHYHGNKEFADHPAMDTVKLCCEVQINAGAPGNVPQTIYEAAKSHPDLTDVVLNIYNTEDHPDKTEIIRQWISKTFDALLNSILLRSGRVATQEEANKEREKRREHLLDAFQKGYVPHGSMGMVLGRKVQQ